MLQSPSIAAEVQSSHNYLMTISVFQGTREVFPHSEERTTRVEGFLYKLCRVMHTDVLILCYELPKVRPYIYASCMHDCMILDVQPMPVAGG